MKTLIQRIGYIFLGICIIAVFVAGFLAYFVTSYNEATNVWSDGFGRTLTQTPAFIRFVFGQERLYPGFYWFLFDSAVFFAIISGTGLFIKVLNWKEDKVRQERIARIIKEQEGEDE